MSHPYLKKNYKEKLEKFFQFNQLQTPEQIQKIIRHICTLA